jgi:predicted ferric reductase
LNSSGYGGLVRGTSHLLGLVFRRKRLAALLAPIERAFGGLDRVALWHRHAAVAGVLLLISHIALVSSAPDRYATSLGHALGDIALIGLLVLAVWALAPSLRVARWPGPIQRMARATYSDG